eukprot:s2958_g3.t1
MGKDPAAHLSLIVPRNHWHHGHLQCAESELRILFSADHWHGSADKTQILELCTNVAAKEGRHGPAEVMAFFVEQCMKNMHIVLAFSPIGENFRRRVRMFPSLVNCCTIDWFHEWPDAALQSVANHFLGKTGMPDEVLKGVVNICVAMQKSVFVLAERFQKEVQRYYYVTPTSYLELINAFKGLLSIKQDEVSKIKSRYDVGLDKIMSTEEQVTTMQAELEELKPTLKKTAEDTASGPSGVPLPTVRHWWQHFGSHPCILTLPNQSNTDSSEKILACLQRSGHHSIWIVVIFGIHSMCEVALTFAVQESGVVKSGRYDLMR